MIVFEAGGLVKSMAGHDKTKLFIIIRTDQEYVYLVDGKIRTMNNPKRKKKKHVQYIRLCDEELKQKLAHDEHVPNEEIKRAIKLLRR